MNGVYKNMEYKMLLNIIFVNCVEAAAVGGVTGSHKDMVLHVHVHVLIHAQVEGHYQEQHATRPVVIVHPNHALVHTHVLLVDHSLELPVIHKVVTMLEQHVHIHVTVVDLCLDLLVIYHKALQ